MLLQNQINFRPLSLLCGVLTVAFRARVELAEADSKKQFDLRDAEALRFAESKGVNSSISR